MTDEIKQWEYDKGYEKGKKHGAIEELEKIKAEIEILVKVNDDLENYGISTGMLTTLGILDKHISELKGELTMYDKEAIELLTDLESACENDRNKQALKRGIEAIQAMSDIESALGGYVLKKWESRYEDNSVKLLQE